MYALLMKTYINKSYVLNNEITNIETLACNEKSKPLETFFENVDLSLLRNEIDFYTIKEIINFVLNGILEKYIKQLIYSKSDDLMIVK